MSRPSALLTLLAASLLPLPAAAQHARQLTSPASPPEPTPGADSPRRGDTAFGAENDQPAVPPPPGVPAEEVAEVDYPIPSAERAPAAAPAPSLQVSSRITTRLRSLDASLRVLSTRGGANVVNAVLNMLTGALAVTLGLVKDDPADWMSAYLYVYGGAAALRGVLELALSPNASGPAITYQHMPMNSEAQIARRLGYGEHELAGLAEQALVARVLDASISMAAGVAVLPIYLAPNNFDISDPLDYFILIGAGVSIVGGVITLATTSTEEQRWQAYQALRERLEAERREDEVSALSAWSPRPTWRVSASPSPRGGFAGLRGTF